MAAADHIALLLAGVTDLRPDDPDADTTRAILAQAERFASDVLETSGAAGDSHGCRLVDGRVRLPEILRQAWTAYYENGWNELTAPQSLGGQGLTLTVATAVQLLFDGSDVALGMLALNARCALRLLANVASPDVQAVWLPRISSGEWGATICISESDAGSDVGRIWTRAEPDGDGRFRITGQKCWISYGDHDLTPGIVHFILARPPGAPAGTRGLSLYLLPDRTEDGRRNGVTVLRIEEKLGLHASPTCLLAFENALAIPLGEPGRGLPALFEMIVAMRLGVAAQGSALAARAASIALQYAGERYQGGPADAPPVPIHQHAEVRRALLELTLNADTMTALTLQAAAWIDAGDAGDRSAAARAAVLLPVVKVLASEAAFVNASLALDVLGGAGYTREWPVERLLRDSRVFSVYEGTTAIQALDFTFRHLLGKNRTAAADVLDRLAPRADLRERFRSAVTRVSGAPRRAQELAALPLLRLFGLACVDGILRRYAAGAEPLATRFTSLLAVHEIALDARADALLAQTGMHDLDLPFDALFAQLAGVY